MSVLVLIPDLKHKGGVTNYYKCLKLDNEVYIRYMNVNTIATDDSAVSGYFRQLALFKKLCYLPIVYFKFILLAINHQIIHVNPSLNYKSYFRDMGFILISRLMRKKILIFFRGWEDDYEDKIKNSRLLSFLFNISYSNANRYILLGLAFKKKLLELGVDKDKRFYIESTIADASYIKYFNIEEKIKSFESQVNLLFISRILRSKGIYIAVDAFAECVKNNPHKKITLYIAGDGEELENVKQYVYQRTLKNIKFVGYAANRLKGDLLLKCHILIFPTYYGEGLPNTILECMLYGMPIISRVVGGIPDVVEHGVNGYLDTSIDVHIYASYCNKLIDNPQLYNQIARTNFNKASSLYTIEVVRSRMLNIYKDMIEDNK